MRTTLISSIGPPTVLECVGIGVERAWNRARRRREQTEYPQGSEGISECAEFCHAVWVLGKRKILFKRTSPRKLGPMRPSRWQLCRGARTDAFMGPEQEPGEPRSPGLLASKIRGRSLLRFRRWRHEEVISEGFPDWCSHAGHIVPAGLGGEAGVGAKGQHDGRVLNERIVP